MSLISVSTVYWMSCLPQCYSQCRATGAGAYLSKHWARGRIEPRLTVDRVDLNTHIHYRRKVRAAKYLHVCGLQGKAIVLRLNTCRHGEAKLNYHRQAFAGEDAVGQQCQPLNHCALCAYTTMQNETMFKPKKQCFKRIINHLFAFYFLIL